MTYIKVYIISFLVLVAILCGAYIFATIRNWIREIKYGYTNDDSAFACSNCKWYNTTRKICVKNLSHWKIKAICKEKQKK